MMSPHVGFVRPGGGPSGAGAFKLVPSPAASVAHSGFVPSLASQALHGGVNTSGGCSSQSQQSSHHGMVGGSSQAGPIGSQSQQGSHHGMAGGSSQAGPIGSQSQQGSHHGMAGGCSQAGPIGSNRGDTMSSIGSWGSEPPPKAASPARSWSSSDKQAYPATASPPTSAADRAEMERLSRELKQAQDEVCRLRSENVQFQQSSVAATVMECLRQERDQSVLDAARAKGKIKMLEQDCSVLKARLQEASLVGKIRMLLISIQRVKQLRLQFPTDQKTRDNLEWAINLITQTEGIVPFGALEVIAKVKATMTSYQHMQETIKACSDLTNLEQLVGQRDQARKNLHECLAEFVEVSATLPLLDKQTELQEVLNSLSASHPVFLKTEIKGSLLPLADAIRMFKDWKSQKMVEFQDCRTLTNTCHNSVNSALQLLQQELALDMQSTGESPLLLANLEDPLNKFQNAVNKEIETTDLEQSSDSGFVAMVLQSLMNEIRSELLAISTLASLRTEYGELMQQIGRWLDRLPDAAELTALRKTIRSLKSRLRHKLADKQDLEDSDDNNGEELRQLSGEVSDVRLQLQTAFLKEDQLLAELSKLSEGHFPELVLQNPDLGIDNEVEYCGLVKLGRALEYFDLANLSGIDKKTVVKGTFCGNPIVHKEFIIEDSLGIRKGDFLRRAVAYNNIINPHMLQIEAIFFVKNERCAYVQLPYYEHSVSDLVNSTGLQDEAMYKVLVGVLRGLHALHEAKLVHGSVHPNNVFVNHDGQGVLAEYDFSKSLHQRAEKKFVTTNGLSFQAPEFNTSPNGEISRASDMYNFGLLGLWLQNSKGMLSHDIGGVPVLSSQCIQPACLAEMLRTLLVENPAARPTAANLLMEPYFAKSPFSRSAFLQLRAKQPSPAGRDRTQGGGILKNSSPPPLSSPPAISIPTLVEHPIDEAAPITTACTTTTTTASTANTQSPLPSPDADREVVTILAEAATGVDLLAEVMGGPGIQLGDNRETNANVVIHEGDPELDVAGRDAFVEDDEAPPLEAISSDVDGSFGDEDSEQFTFQSTEGVQLMADQLRRLSLDDEDPEGEALHTAHIDGDNAEEDNVTAEDLSSCEMESKPVQTLLDALSIPEIQVEGATPLPSPGYDQVMKDVDDLVEEQGKDDEVVQVDDEEVAPLEEQVKDDVVPVKEQGNDQVELVGEQVKDELELVEGQVDQGDEKPILQEEVDGSPATVGDEVTIDQQVEEQESSIPQREKSIPDDVEIPPDATTPVNEESGQMLAKDESVEANPGDVVTQATMQQVTEAATAIVDQSVYTLAALQEEMSNEQVLQNITSSITSAIAGDEKTPSPLSEAEPASQTLDGGLGRMSPEEMNSMIASAVEKATAQLQQKFEDLAQLQEPPVVDREASSSSLEEPQPEPEPEPEPDEHDSSATLANGPFYSIEE